jgi:hypothetical protein
VRDSLADALADGTRGVTAKIRWLSSAAADLDDRTEEGRPRWIHCTPLLGTSGAVGVWMVVLVDEEKNSAPVRRFRPAPPVVDNIRKEKARNGSPHRFSNGIDSSDDEFDMRTRSRTSERSNRTPQVDMRTRSRTSERSNGTPQKPARDGLRLNMLGSSVSVNLHSDEQRAIPGSSINSFALG